MFEINFNEQSFTWWNAQNCWPSFCHKIQYKSVVFFVFCLPHFLYYFMHNTYIEFICEQCRSLGPLFRWKSFMISCREKLFNEIPDEKRMRKNTFINHGYRIVYSIFKIFLFHSSTNLCLSCIELFRMWFLGNF